MMKLRFLLLFIFALTTVSAHAAKYRRLVNFEWEAIEGATGYEIELSAVRDQKEVTDEPKVFNFKVKEAAWNGRLTPGKYLMRLRSKDYRGVPGDWSPPSDFNVGLDQVVLKSPLKDKIETDAADKKEIEFAWEPVGGSDEYQFTLTSEDGKTAISQKTKEPRIKVEVPVAQNYSWNVSASSVEGIVSEGNSSSKFALEGKKLSTPVLEKPETEFVREVKWKAPDFAESYDIKIIRKDEKTKKFIKFKDIENTNVASIDFDADWPGGAYKMAVRARGKMRPESDLGTLAFKVKSGDRSPAAEYTALVKKSIDRVTGWYAIASYLITEVKFSGVNPEKNSVTSYNALGGTGRIGLGWFNPNTAWGFLGIVDMSGFTFNGKTSTYASAEMNAIYRVAMGDRSEVRLQAGPYFKEQPETIGDPSSSTSEDLKIVSAGPHLGAEIWYSLTPKMGIQVNAHLYTSLMKIQTPNGQNLEPSISTQFGVLGSYRFTPTFTGLVGWAMREDRMKYSALPNADSEINLGDTNESTIVGNYLNFFAEWAF